MKRTAIKGLIAMTAATATLSLTAIAAASRANAAVYRTRRGTQPSGNWAGYYAVPANGKGPEAVFAAFTIPKVNCRDSIGKYPAYGSMWAGIGGLGDDISNGKSAWLEQAGIQIHCTTKKSQPVYEPFWEIVRPHDPVKDPYGNPYDAMVFHQDTEGKNATVKPGDKITAQVFDTSYQKSGQFVLSVNVNGDGDHPVTFSKQINLPPTAYTGRTAEVITEYPLGAASPTALEGDMAWLYTKEIGVNPIRPSRIGLINLGDVHYSEAMYLTHLPGDVKPEGVPVAQGKIVMGWPIGHQDVYIYPGPAHPTIKGSTVKDGFSTHYYISS